MGSEQRHLLPHSSPGGRPFEWELQARSVSSGTSFYLRLLLLRLLLCHLLLSPVFFGIITPPVSTTSSIASTVTSTVSTTLSKSSNCLYHDLIRRFWWRPLVVVALLSWKTVCSRVHALGGGLLSCEIGPIPPAKLMRSESLLDSSGTWDPPEDVDEEAHRLLFSQELYKWLVSSYW
eukprot:2301742-Amphidinium_carterae.2